MEALIRVRCASKTMVWECFKAGGWLASGCRIELEKVRRERKERGRGGGGERERERPCRSHCNA
jgi:hypothetical protein